MPDAEFDWSWTADDAGWIPSSIDLSTPSPARMYDYALGGKDNFAVDREAVERVAAHFPEFRDVAVANRGFLSRAVTAMAEAGVRQFLDLGTGIPTSPSVHEVAAEVHPDCRVVYVDHDPIVMAHARARQASHPGVVTVMEDLRDPAAVLGHRLVRDHLDPAEPIGLVLCAVLHFVRRDAASAVLDRYTRVLAPGSHLAIATATSEGMTADGIARIEAIYEKSSSPIVFRSRAEVEQLFEGFDLLPPGLTDVTGWRARGRPLGIRIMAGLGVLP